ncbi:hypothetical protein B0H12DRAFT_680226 [Mycena haematopus]|nr:hypothetical protein B0H12DRAFT_680226 [Mycena haematopus]
MSFWVNRMGTIDYDDNPVAAPSLMGERTHPCIQARSNICRRRRRRTKLESNVKEIIVQGTSVQVTSGASSLAAFSLLSLNISGPASDVAAIWAAVPDAVPSTTHSGYYQFPCSTTVNVSVSFGGLLWNIIHWI